jgi:nitroreductase
MNTFLELANVRQSDRAYLDKPVEQEKVDRIIEAARLAPSACNAQPWKLVVVRDAAKRHAIADATSTKIIAMNHFSKQAPLQFVLIEEPGNFTSKFGSWIKGKHFPEYDLGIVASHICLAAADEGLGSCILGWLNEEKVRKILSIPHKKRVAMVILVGYTAQPSRKKVRKPLSELVSYETYK